MNSPLRTALAATALASSLALSQVAVAQPRTLDNAELDRVTAGVVIGILGGALATGSLYASAETNSGGATNYTALPGGGFVESGAGGSTASAVSNTGNNSTTAATGGGTVGTPLVNTTVGGSLASPVGQASVSFTYVTGGTYFLP